VQNRIGHVIAFGWCEKAGRPGNYFAKVALAATHGLHRTAQAGETTSGCPFGAREFRSGASGPWG